MVAVAVEWTAPSFVKHPLISRASFGHTNRWWLQGCLLTTRTANPNETLKAHP